MSSEAGFFTKVAAALSVRSSRPVMVVGMHRSGTSFLTGSLQMAGLELGKHSAWNRYNRKGNRENDDFVAFHDAVLTARGAAWNIPPATMVEWTPQEREHAQSLVAGYRGVARWGFKDPRALLMVDAWWNLLPKLSFVGIFRNPEAVARSLEHRSQTPKDEAFALWNAYNQRLLSLHERAAFPLLCFDEEETVLQQKLDEVLSEIGLRPLGDQPFYAGDLRHHHHAPDEIPSSLASLYDALRARSR